MCWVRYCLFLYKILNRALAVFINDWAISMKDKVLSNVAPKYFTDLVDLIAKLLQVNSRLGLHLIFWGEPKRMDSVLPRWSESLLSSLTSLFVSTLFVSKGLIQYNISSYTTFAFYTWQTHCIMQIKHKHWLIQSTIDLSSLNLLIFCFYFLRHQRIKATVSG